MRKPRLLVDMLTARLPAARIAQRLNIDVATLRSYLARLRAAEGSPLRLAPRNEPWHGGRAATPEGG